MHVCLFFSSSMVHGGYWLWCKQKNCFSCVYPMYVTRHTLDIHLTYKYKCMFVFIHLYILCMAYIWIFTHFTYTVNTKNIHVAYNENTQHIQINTKKKNMKQLFRRLLEAAAMLGGGGWGWLEEDLRFLTPFYMYLHLLLKNVAIFCKWENVDTFV